MLVGIAVLIGTTGCDYVATKGLLGRLIDARGAVVQSSAANGAAATPAAAGTNVQRGDTIRTAAGGSATICLLPGLFLQLNADTIVQLEELKLVKSGDDFNYAVASREARVRLLQGSLTATTPQIVTYVDLQIVTASGSVELPAFATVVVEAAPNFTRGTVARGEVMFRSDPAADGVLVTAGQYLQMAATKRADALEPRPAVDDKGALKNLAAADRFETIVARWSAAQRGAAPPG